MSCGYAPIQGSIGLNFEITAEDLLPILRVQILGDAKSPVDLSLAVSVMFVMKHDGTGTEVTGEMVIDDAATGKVSYTWQAGDTDLWGVWIGRAVVTFAGGKTMTFPTCPEKGGLIIGVCGG
jgi:hypothetical protein